MIDGRSHAAWFHDVMLELAKVRKDGRQREIPGMLDMIGRVAGPQQRHIAERTLLAAAMSEAGGRGIGDLEQDQPPGWPCDFCAEPDTGLYFPFEPFFVDEVMPNGLRNLMPSGDRWHVCQRCHDYVEASQWKALRAWVGPTCDAPMVVLLWSGFRMNRTGPAIAFTPGTDPAAAR